MPNPPVFVPPQKHGHYRFEIAPLGLEAEDFCERVLQEGWEFLTLTTLPVNTAPPTPMNPHPPQVLGLMLVFRRKVKSAEAAGENRLAVPVLETLASHVKAAMPFMQVTGIMREKLEQAQAAAEAFLQP